MLDDRCEVTRAHSCQHPLPAGRRPVGRLPLTRPGRGLGHHQRPSRGQDRPGPTTYTAWVAILEEAERQGQTETLLKQARTDYPHLAPLAAAVSAYTAWAASGRPGGATPASSPVTTEGRTVIHTGGGAYVGGGVTIGPGGAFVGRDQVTTTTSTQGGSLAEFTALLAEIRRSVAQVGLDADTTAALDADLRLVENQANKPAPNKALLLSRLEGAARLLTAAAGAATAVDRLLPAVQQAIAWASQLFR
ncbi:MAG: hypothetical protein HZY76_07710 [Anaerolineae bacterium]|nr:MAG: hypothetical protein HZY76_07710 [Anaerolineae bacterium]